MNEPIVVNFQQLSLEELKHLQVVVDNRIREKRVQEVRIAIKAMPTRNPRVVRLFESLDSECRFNRHVLVDTLLEEIEVLLDIAA